MGIVQEKPADGSFVRRRPPQAAPAEDEAG